MKSFDNRLRKVEEELIPDKRYIVFYARYKHQEEDAQRQREEYQRLWGNTNTANLIFHILRDYSDESDYEEFIKRKRSECQSNNCFTRPWWEDRYNHEII